MADIVCVYRGRLTCCCPFPLSPCTWYQNLAGQAEPPAGSPLPGFQGHRCCKYEIRGLNNNNKGSNEENIKLKPPVCGGLPLKE